MAAEEQTNEAREITENGRLSSLEFRDLTVFADHETSGDRQVLIVRFEGRITNDNSYSVNRKIHRIFETGETLVILDLNKLEYLNSTGVAMVFSIGFRIKEQNGRLAIGGMHPFLKKVFGMMDMPVSLTVCESMEEARNALLG